MNTPTATDVLAGAPAKPLSLKIFGVGSAGLKLLNRITRAPLPGTAFAAVDTAAEAMADSVAPEKLVLESKLLRGLGTGGDPERGRAAAEEHLSELKAACDGMNLVFIVTGLGGGTGTGVSPVLARVAKETGALVLALVTLPFDCEGNRRRHQAQQGLDQLKIEADGVICLPNQKVSKLIDEQTSLIETFRMSNDLLADCLSGVWRLLARRGLIEIHVADLCALLRDRHAESAFATADAAGPTRSRDVVERLLAHPLLDAGKTLAEADAVLVSLTAGPGLTMIEVNQVMEPINSRCAQAQVLMGAAIDETFGDRLAITLITTRHVEAQTPRTAPGEAPPTGSRPAVERLDQQLLDPRSGARPQCRFVPPPPVLPPERLEELMDEQKTGASRKRKSATKLRQGQLPLEIISKGRFDKSEPTIHKGEDLDVPTYIRRGVPLN
jgi:cell division protein FtsZ